jgi:hypothetical protein
LLVNTGKLTSRKFRFRPPVFPSLCVTPGTWSAGTKTLNRERKIMKNVLVASTLVAGLALGLGGVASADGDNSKFKVDPFHFGQGGLATWARDAGEPGQKGDKEQFGLYLQKATATGNFAAAGARINGITPMPAAALRVLAFDISGVAGQLLNDLSPGGFPANGYCGAGAPRFNVSHSDGRCFLGCAHGDATQDPVTGWWEIRFESPFTQYPGCDGPPGPFGAAIGGTVTAISIVLDEGNDLSLANVGAIGLSPGNVVLDNIRVNARVVGKPGDGRD